MAHIKITKGLDIPIKGHPKDNVKSLLSAGHASLMVTPAQIALNLKPFEDVKFRLLVKVGDDVKIGQPLAEDKSSPGRMFAAPASGVVKEIRRGLKRSLSDIVIDVGRQEQFFETPLVDIPKTSREEIIEALKARGGFAHIRQRPFNMLADPAKIPRSIFVKAVESAPFVPPAEMQVAGHEREFQAGLNILAGLTEGPVNLVYRNDCTLRAFTEAQNVQRHTVEGPHPAGTHSLHIQRLDQITSAGDIIWTLDAHDVVNIGCMLTKGIYFTDRVISIAGPAVLPDMVGYFKARAGYPIGGLIAGRIPKGHLRLISGDPLMGKKVEVEDFLGFHDYAFCVIEENTSREFLHFLGIGASKYTFSRAYLTGHFDNKEREYDFTTNQHGEHRAFIDSSLYDKVMPLDIPTMPLVKALLAEDYDLAELYGLLEVDSEDFALPTFVCPSKMEMSDIVKQGLKRYAKDILS